MGLKIIYVVISIVFIFCCSSSCKKKCTDSRLVTTNLDSRLLSYFDFYKKGSYWIYKNSDMSQKDSLYVTQYYRGYEYSDLPCEKVEVVKFVLKSTGYNIIFTDSVCMKGEAGVDMHTMDCPNSIFFKPGALGHFYFFSDSISGDNSIINRKSSVTLNSQIYNGNLLGIANNSDTIYMQEHIGIIGWKKGSQVFNLTNKHLNP